MGPSPNRRLDSIWGRCSYSSWISGSNNKALLFEDPLGIEEGRDTEQSENTADMSLQEKDPLLKGWDHKSTQILKNRGPLDDFPRGPIAGDCLHRILEQLDFCKSLEHPDSEVLIERELQRAGFEKTLLPSVKSGIERVLTTPLGGPLGGFQLNQLPDQRRIHELKFDLPIATEGGPLRSESLAQAFRIDSWARFSDSYAEQVAGLDFRSSGFFTGSIDLIFSDGEDPLLSRWWVLDWKSNWIGQRDHEGMPHFSSPAYYHEKALEEQMLLHHYPLQAHLYLVALHRFLQWRLPDYNPNRHLGGYVYVFLRGVPGGEALREMSSDQKIPGLFVEKIPYDRVMELNRLIKQGG